MAARTLGAMADPPAPVTWKAQFTENPGLPPGFRQWEVSRKDGSRMIAFLAHLKNDVDVRKPLLVFLDGSGAPSLLVRHGDRLAVGMLAVVAGQAGTAYDMTAVENRAAVLGELGSRSGGGRLRGISASHDMREPRRGFASS
ncbi:MAG: hypothetical protein FLDDKLPJ_00797 [Phycisphaerae bacterium]|nr:hypothetical protein [Phycisphaerae bacterium]